MNPEDAKAHFERLHMAYKQVPDEVWNDLAAFINPHYPSFVPTDPGGRQTAYNEGQRTVWLHIEARRKMDYRDVERLAEAVQEQGDE